MLDLDAIKARCEAATPGPWDGKTKIDGDHQYIGTTKKPIADICNLYGAESKANLDFIVHSRDDIPALVRELEISLNVGIELDRQVRRLQRERDAVVGDFATLIEQISNNYGCPFCIHKDKDSGDCGLDWDDDATYCDWQWRGPQEAANNGQV